MNNQDAMELCLALMWADSETAAIQLLKDRGFWDDPRYWRYYGDDELNWNRAGNQQGRADFALNEKLVNTIDTRLMLECMLAGVAPESPGAPHSIREAVNRFIEKSWSGTLKVSGGRVEDWPTDFRRQVADGISVFVTGPKHLKPCVNVADLGEGQTPEAFPHTLLSLGKNNKIKVNFVQGKFGQGSTGAIRFCGKERLQLIISRRHPKLLGNPAVSPSYPVHDTDSCWGFTIVRREGEGQKVRSPFLSYLAPLDVEGGGKERLGRVLRFHADELPIFPQGDNAYQRHVTHGTLVKLYEYNLKNVSNILRRDGLRPKIDLLLPEPALPMRFHECRDYQKTGQEQTETMSGLFARLNNNKNLEDVKPATISLTVHGHELFARIYAFKPGSSKTYRASEGVIFTINGQTQGYIKANFFARPKRVGLQRLAQDLLVVLDCSSLSAVEQDDMFMPSRDRLVEDNAFAMEIERKLESALHDHPGLRDLRNARAKMDMEEQLADNKPLEDVLRRVLKSSPNLARIFGQGLRLQNPFKPENVQKTEKPFEGKPHPTFFRFAGKEQGEVLARSAHFGSRVRLAFETDVEDEYFTRKIDRGEKVLARLLNGERQPIADYIGPNLVDGKGNVTFDLPEDVSVGDTVEVEFTVRDVVTGAEFANRAKLPILAAVEPHTGPKPKPKPKPGEPPGNEAEGSSGINFPEVFWIEQKAPTWPSHFSSLDDCLHILEEGDVVDGKYEPAYKFYLNADNKALKNELAFTKLPADAVKKQFEIGVVLLAMALIHDDNQTKGAAQKAGNGTDKEDADESTIEKRAALLARAVAPVIIPMIQSLGELADEAVDLSDLVGQAA
ncbi:hypothetical protein [Mesorhizobium sp.]|uniref:hypothetical protein n=1 Tax=Mesorhizobium sp. TaxID=1871066 RepID=UPI000FEA201B|nr:hypothetical protein [Mesorhizobium sp.]RWE53347.1 MAG: hypothetical protein EOS67_27635 [Mesorhizobium sp.]